MSKSSYPRFQRARDFKRTQRTAGSVVIGTTILNVDTATDITLTAQVGDYIECSLGGLVSLVTGSDASFSVATIVGGSVVNYISGQVLAVGAGVPNWYCPNRDTAQGVAGWNLSGAASPYAIVAGDLSGGTVTLRVRAIGGGGGAISLWATTGVPFNFWAKNLGPMDPN